MRRHDNSLFTAVRHSQFFCCLLHHQYNSGTAKQIVWPEKKQICSETRFQLSKFNGVDPFTARSSVRWEERRHYPFSLPHSFPSFPTFLPLLWTTMQSDSKFKFRIFGVWEMLIVLMNSLDLPVYVRNDHKPPSSNGLPCSSRYWDTHFKLEQETYVWNEDWTPRSTMWYLHVCEECSGPRGAWKHVFGAEEALIWGWRVPS